MKILFDTSVLVAALLKSHPVHHRCINWLSRAHEREFEFLIPTHVLAELYAVLTSIPIQPRLSPGQTRQMIHHNILPVATVVALTVSDYTRVINRLADLGLSGGNVYDALIVRAAEKSKADYLLTLNRKNFLKVWPEGAERLIAV